MPDVISTQPADVRLWVALDVHKFSIVAARLPPTGGRAEPVRIETTEKAIRRSVKSLRSGGLAVCYEAGPGGFVSLIRGGLLRVVQPRPPRRRGCVICCAAATTSAARAPRPGNRVAKQLLRHGRIYRDGKKSWTPTHRAWVNRQ